MKLDTQNSRRYYDTATHKVVPKDAVVLDMPDITSHLSGGANFVIDTLRRKCGVFGKKMADQIEAQTTGQPAPDRPLDAATIDVSEFGGIWPLIDQLRDIGGWFPTILADQFEKQAGERPRIDEPGWGQVVVAHTRENDERIRWVHVSPDRDFATHWSPEDPAEYERKWSDLIDPEAVAL